MDHRQAPRITTSTAIAFSKAGDYFSGIVKNMSTGGVFIQTDTLLDADTELALRMRLADDLMIMDIVGRVVWTKQSTAASPCGMGIEFTNISATDRKRIERYVDARLHAPLPPERLEYAGQKACFAEDQSVG